MINPVEYNPPFPNNYSREFLVIDRGEGVWLWDRGGNKYLDFGSGIAVNALGYGNEDLAQAAADQMRKLVHISNLYSTEPAISLAKKLVALGNFQAVHLGNSGSEANEAAIKYARIYSLRIKGPGHHKILSFSGGFHGRTLGALSATYKKVYRDPFEPLVPGFEIIHYNDEAELAKTLDDTFAAVLVEPIQGEGGLEQVTPGFASLLNELCARHDVLLVADEIQSGLGRCGAVFASDLVGLKPDIVTLAKPLAAGLPLSATLIPAKVNSLVQNGDHGGTFGGGPVTTAVANIVIGRLTDAGFLGTVVQKGRYLAAGLGSLVGKYPSVAAGVRGLGLLAGLKVLNADKNCPEIQKRAREKGLIVLRSGSDLIRIAPPLIITEKEIDDGMAVLDEILKELV
jgi:acetylornithine/N-succinyldiaminopimelate aminotransferase